MANHPSAHSPARETEEDLGIEGGRSRTTRSFTSLRAVARRPHPSHVISRLGNRSRLDPCQELAAVRLPKERCALVTAYLSKRRADRKARYWARRSPVAALGLYNQECLRPAALTSPPPDRNLPRQRSRGSRNHEEWSFST